MIIDLKKYLFIGAKEDLREFFLRAQEKGFIEFISSKGKKVAELPKEIKNLIDAVKILRKQPVKTPYVGGGDLSFAHEIVQRILGLKAEIDKLSEEKRFLEAEISRVAPFGDFSFDDIVFIENAGHRKIQFFCMKTAKRHKVKLPEEFIYIGTDYDLDYFIAINKEPKTYPDMIEMRFEQSLSELKNYFAFVSESLHQIEAELKGFAGYIPFLKESLLEHLDSHFLSSTKKEVEFPIEGSLFSIEGWVPENKIDQLFPLVDSLAVHVEPISVEAKDRVPTHMQNKGSARLGEDLVKIYDIPSPEDKDPSPWVFWAFALFFAMIIADAGYGLLYLGIAAFIKYKFPDMSGKAKRVFKIFVSLSIGCIIWGILTTSFFGIAFKPDNPISKVSLIHYLAEKKADYLFREKDEVYEEWAKRYPKIHDARSGKEMLDVAVDTKEGKISYKMLDEFDDNILLEISLLVGVLHIAISLFRYLGRNWANFGWVVFLIGGYLYFPRVLNTTSFTQFIFSVSKESASTYGIQLIYIGIALAVILAIIQKGLKGISEVTNLIRVTADVLSYLRLYALALAGTIMARTFNTLGVEIGLVIGILVILFGHIINIQIGTMAGVIHGLRLNFIEWYHYCFDGGGKLFNPLRKLKIHAKE
ncbi:MAG TPA: V-type ATP synthase subunit I [Rhabdochlamydiaceae bacterium]|nr:V-type ATP synthase subunit I [Rhabdochlamydiaceae bacterium]